jgi:hypothetical protein
MNQILAIVCLLYVAAQATLAQDNDKKNWGNAVIGYRYYDFQYRFNHDTHPDDSFLPNSGVPGSAGTTELKGLHMFAAGGGYERVIGKGFSWRLEAGGLFAVNSQRKQNENDPRPPSGGSFIYTNGYGFFAATGPAYQTKHVSISGVAEVARVTFSSGWERFGRNQRQQSEGEVFVSAGPNLCFWFNESSGVEISVRGGKAVQVGAALRIRF